MELLFQGRLKEPLDLETANFDTAWKDDGVLLDEAVIHIK